jgi:hypothetical protein
MNHDDSMAREKRELIPARRDSGVSHMEGTTHENQAGTFLFPHHYINSLYASIKHTNQSMQWTCGSPGRPTSPRTMCSSAPRGVLSPESFRKFRGNRLKTV